MKRFGISLVALCLAVGCGGKKGEGKPEGSAADERATGEPAAAKAGAAADRKEPARKSTPLVERAQVVGVLQRWLEAQNRGDFAGYSALYGEGFQGVRRSGKKTVKLDRAGWLEDRKRMFRRKMTVTATQPEIALGKTGATIRFTQEWASGKYHDVGPKVIRVEKQGNTFVITREEMLESRQLVGTDDLPLASDQLALVYDGKVVLADQADLEWGAGKPRLLDGELSEPDPECETDPPDYEEENERYFDCHDTDPVNAFDEYEATQAVSRQRLPRALGSWAGKALTLYDAKGTPCSATVGSFELWAEWETNSEQAGAGGSKDEEVAETILNSGKPVLLAQLDKKCAGAIFARAAELPRAPQWRLETPGAHLEAAARKELPDLYPYEEIAAGEEALGDEPDVTLVLFVPPTEDGRRYLAVYVSGALNCQERGSLAAVWQVQGEGPGASLEMVFSGSDLDFDVGAAVDVTGDGIPEIVLADGLLLWRDGEYQRLYPLAFPRDVRDRCYCECE